MMTQEPVRHHFAPVFYLKAWADSGRVVRYYRPHDVVVAKDIAPKNTGFEDDLYAFEGVSPDKRYVLEKEFFSLIDGRAANTHRLLLDGKLKSLTNAQRVDWARFMMSTQLRTPFALEELRRLADQNLRANLALKDDPEYKAVRGESGAVTLYEWTEQHQPHVLANAHKQFLPGLIDHEDLGHYLINMHWATLNLSQSTHSLLTADRPLVATHGWKDARAILTFPLSARWLFVATNSPARTYDVTAMSRTELVKKVNEQTVRCAVDFVFGADESHLVFVERRLRRRDEEPIAGPIGRGRPGCPP